MGDLDEFRPQVGMFFARRLRVLGGAGGNGISLHHAFFRPERAANTSRRIGDDGNIATDFSYRNNGRGPDYKEKLALAGDGTLRRFAITGKSTFGSLVDERFVRKGDRAEWAGKVRSRFDERSAARRCTCRSSRPLKSQASWCARLIHESSLKLPGIPGGELSIVKLNRYQRDERQRGACIDLVCHTRRGP